MRFDGIYGDGERENASVKKWGFNFPQFPNTEAPFSRQVLLRAGGEISCLFPAINLNCSPHFFGALPRNNLNFGALRRRRRNKPQTPLDAAIFQSILLSNRKAESQLISILDRIVLASTVTWKDGAGRLTKYIRGT